MSLPRPVSPDQRLLLAHVLGIPLSQLALVEELSPAQLARYRELLDHRAAGVPVQHLTGQAHFRNISVKCGPGVFIPRPETEVLAGWALEVLRDRESARVVELCTGSGAICKALADEHPGLELHAVELSDEAIGYAAGNLAGLGVDLRQGDLATAFPDLDGTVDLVIANPPYVPLEMWDRLPEEVRDYDPHLALFSGQDGLDALRAIAQVGLRLLRAGGWIGAEHAETQSDEVQRTFSAAGYMKVKDNLDLTGRPRFVTGQAPVNGRMAP